METCIANLKQIEGAVERWRVEEEQLRKNLRSVMVVDGLHAPLDGARVVLWTNGVEAAQEETRCGGEAWIPVGNASEKITVSKDGYVSQEVVNPTNRPLYFILQQQP